MQTYLRFEKITVKCANNNTLNVVTMKMQSRMTNSIFIHNFTQLD